MALHHNRVTLIGNIGSELDTGEHGGDKRVSFDMAVNRNYQQNGEWKEETTWINDLTVWGYGAETIIDKFSKGDRIFIEGRLRQDEWEKDGTEYSKLSVTGERVVEMDRDGSGGSGSPNSNKNDDPGELLDDPEPTETEDDIPF